MTAKGWKPNPEQRDRINARKRALWAADGPATQRQRDRNREYGRSHTEAMRVRYTRWISDPANRDKVNGWGRERRRKIPDRIQQYEADRRARLIAAFVETVDRMEVYRRGRGLCGICSDPVDPQRFDVDHILPLSLGGLHAYANCQPAHPSCNYRKPRRYLAA